MNFTTNEIERSQCWGALSAGHGGAPEYLTGLKYNISLIREVASQYCTLTVKDKGARELFVRYFTKLLKKANDLLPGYIEDLKKDQCIEAFCISTGQYREEKFWQWCDWICSDMEGQMVYEDLKRNVDRLQALLAEVEIATRQCNPELFEKFFFDEKLHYNNDGVRKRFDDWMYDNMCPDIEKLRELQALVVADALKLGVMNFAPDPSYQEIAEVKVNYLKKLLPWGYDMSGDFRKSCARWRKFFRWEGTILVINYKKYGKYIQRHYYDFNDVQLQAIFELDMMLSLIHKEMKKLMPTEPLEENEEDNEVLQEIQLMGKELEQQLMPLFYNNEGDVKLFLKEIDGMSPNDITDLVNQWVKDKRISNYGNSRKGDLWKILHDAKLYPRTIQNWNRRVY